MYLTFVWVTLHMVRAALLLWKGNVKMSIFILVFKLSKFESMEIYFLNIHRTYFKLY